MSEPIVEFISPEGLPVVINVRHVVFASPAITQGQSANGALIGSKQLAIGVCAVKLVTGDLLAVKCPMEELHRRLKGQVSIYDDGEITVK